MPNEQHEKLDLQNEKLRFEIEELKIKIEDLKKTKVWDNYIKPIIPVVVTLIIGIWGTILTKKFNKSQLENTHTQLKLAREKNESDKELSQVQLEISKRKNSSDSAYSQTQLQINLSKNEADKLVALTQLEIAKRKNESDKAIAQIDASLSFVKLLQDMPTDNKDLKHQAKTIIAPALPLETIYNIAINELPDNPNVLEILFRTYKDETWKYIIPFIEIYPLKFASSEFWNLFNTRIGNRYDKVCCDSLHELITQAHSSYQNENVKQLNGCYELLIFLEKRQLLNDLYKYLISYNYKSQKRVYALINYFEYINKISESKNYPSFITDLSYDIKTTIEKSNDNALKSDLAIAASTVYDEYHTKTEYSNLAAKYYWEKFDISIGQTPSEGGIYQFIYENRFHDEDVISRKPKQLNAIQILSNSLIQKLTALNFTLFDIDRIAVICYSYSETSLRGSKGPFITYLLPSHSYQLIAVVLKSLDTEKRRQEFSMYLGSLSGDQLFMTISQDSIIGKQYAKLIISWYRDNCKSDWYIPKFFNSIIHKYPELKSKMEGKWGIWKD
jgi:hypothetical protein